MRLRMPKVQAKIIILIIWSAALITSLPTALLSNLTLASPDATVPSQATSVNPTIIVPEVTITSPPRSSQATSSSTPNTAINPPESFHAINDKSTVHAPNRLSQLGESEVLLAGRTNLSHPDVPQDSNTAGGTNGEQEQYFCQESWSFWPKGKYYYSMALMVLQFVLPLFVLVITYTRIVIVVWGKRTPGEEDNARDARIARSKRKVSENRNSLFQFSSLSINSLDSSWAFPFWLKSRARQTNSSSNSIPRMNLSESSICCLLNRANRNSFQHKFIEVEYSLHRDPQLRALDSKYLRIVQYVDAPLVLAAYPVSKTSIIRDLDSRLRTYSI